MYKHVDSSSASIPRLGRLSRSTVRAAIEVLRRRHGIASSDVAFDVLRTISQTCNVKLRSVAAAVVISDITGELFCDTGRCAPPHLSFSARPGSNDLNRTDVLHDLMHAALDEAGADCSTVQLRDPIYGGLVIEGHSGFAREFVDFFGYVDTEGTACGVSLAHSRQVVVDDVESSSAFNGPELAMMMTAGVGSVVSTPLLDHEGIVWGVVSTHYGQPRRGQDAARNRAIQNHANDCARWLSWYDRTVMPGVVAAVHAAAATAAPKSSIAAGT